MNDTNFDSESQNSNVVPSEETDSAESGDEAAQSQADASGVRRPRRLRYKSDPVIIYGTGIKNYFRLQEALLVAFFIFSILACWQMSIFKKFDGLGNIKEYVSSTAENSIGNMGYSSTVCAKMPIDWQHDAVKGVNMAVHCQKSTSITKVLSSGIMLDKAFPGGTFDAVHSCYVDPDNVE